MLQRHLKHIEDANRNKKYYKSTTNNNNNSNNNNSVENDNLHLQHIFSFLLIISKLKDSKYAVMEDFVKDVWNLLDPKNKEHLHFRKRLLLLSVTSVFGSSDSRSLSLDEFQDGLDPSLTKWHASSLWKVTRHNNEPDKLQVRIWHVWVAHLILKIEGWTPSLVATQLRNFDTNKTLLTSFQQLISYHVTLIFTKPHKYMNMMRVTYIAGDILIRSRLFGQEFSPLINTVYNSVHFNLDQFLELLENNNKNSNLQGRKATELNIHLLVLCSRICRVCGQAGKAIKYASNAASESKEFSVIHNLGLILSFARKFEESHTILVHLLDKSDDPDQTSDIKKQIVDNITNWRNAMPSQSIPDPKQWMSSAGPVSSITLPSNPPVHQSDCFLVELDMYI